MGGSVNDPNLAQEWRNPGLQARQPLARLNDRQSALSSTEPLNSNFFGEGGLASLVKNIARSDSSDSFLNEGMLSGTGSNTGSVFNAVPATNIGGTLPQLPTSNVAFTNSGVGGSSNSNNILSSLASATSFDGAFNSSFFDDLGQQQDGDYFASNQAFNFGDTPFFGGTSKEINTLNKFANLSGNGNSSINNALSVLNMTPNRLIDTYAQSSGNEWASLLNDDWSQRGMINKAATLASPSYGGLLTSGIDYMQGYNNYGALGSLAGMALNLNPVGMLASNLIGQYLGEEYGTQWNDNLDNYASDFAKAQGFEAGTKEFDDAVNARRQVGYLSGVQDPSQVQVVEKSQVSTTTDSFGNDISSNHDVSEGTVAGDYSEAGFSQSDMDFATSGFDDSGSSNDGTSDSSDDPGGDDDDAGGWSW